MKIALITDGIAPYVIGGMQKHSFYLARYFARHKIYVDLYHYNDSSYDIQRLEVFSEEEKLYINSIVLQFPEKGDSLPGHYIRQSYRYSCLVYDAIKPKLNGYDFIYTKGFTGWKLISEKHKGNIECCPIGVKFHGYEMYQVAPELKAKLQQYLLRPSVKKITRWADVVFSYGGKITDIIRSLGVPDQKILEIPSGVETAFISATIARHPGSMRKFVFLGRAERRKGIIELNAVIKRLLAEKRVFQFEFVGPIPEQLKVNHEGIIYHGETRDPQIIKRILHEADVLVCPSWSEGFPNVILEAMASGLAIIATDVGAVSAMVSEKNGWLIKPADQEMLHNALVSSILEKNLSAKKEYSLKLVNTTFNWDVIAEQTILKLKGLL